MKILIRKLHHSDYLGIIDLYNRVFEKNIMYHDITQKNNKYIIVAEADGSIVGFMEFDILNNELENKYFALVNNICLENKYKSSKIEILLVQACEKLCVEKKCSSIFIINNNIELDFYKKLGFDINNVKLIKKQIA